MSNNPTMLLVALAGVLLVWAGCDSFLEPQPQSFSSTNTFYESPEDFEGAINGAYTQFRTLIGGEPAPGGGEEGSESYRNATDRRGPTLTKHFDVNLPNTVSGDPQTDEFTMVASNVNAINLWNLTYDLVKEANVILTRIGDVDFEDAALKARITGEAKFLRAFAYWLAAQVWGDVPLILSDARTPDEGVPEGGRTPVAEVYSQVTTDLQEAIGGLPIRYSGDNVGRITRGAAKFLLGRTYLLTGDYQAALDQFEALDGGEYAYTLLSDYRSIFNPTNKNNAETLLEIQYNPSLAGQPDINIFDEILPFNSGEDLLPDSAPLFVPLGNLMPTPDVIESCQTPTTYACYQEGDQRKDASIAWYVKEGNSQYPEIAWPPRTSTSAAGDSLPYLYKYYWPESANSEGASDINWVVFRFADVLLSAAEAHWRLGQPGEAQAYLNRVRERAGLGDANLANFDGRWTGSALGDAILHERAQELLAEGHFWLDLKRFGSDVALKVMRAHAEKFRERDPKIDERSYIIEEYKLLYPIPPEDIDLSGLEQNPGWG